MHQLSTRLNIRELGRVRAAFPVPCGSRTHKDKQQVGLAETPAPADHHLHNLLYHHVAEDQQKTRGFWYR